MNYPSCPICKASMEKAKLQSRNSFFRCFYHGLWIPPGFFRSFKGGESIDYDLMRFRKGPFPATKDAILSCPNCHKSLKPTFVKSGTEIIVDQCFSCGGVWFDIGEMENVVSGTAASIDFPKVDLKETYDGQVLPPSVRDREEGISQDDFHPLMLLGLPIEVDKHVKKTKPFTSYLVFMLAIVMTLRGLRSREFISKWAYHPLYRQEHLGLNLLSSIFLHAGLLHFVGNFYFFWIFADNVEDEKGPIGMLLLFLLAGVGGNIAYSQFGGMEPSIGASGAVSGLLAYYCLRFPKNRLRTMMFLFPLNVSAPVFFLYYISFQIVFSIFQIGGFANQTNFIAHVGGAIVGLLFYLEDLISRPEAIHKT